MSREPRNNDRERDRDKTVLEVRDLSVSYRTRYREVKAVREVSFAVDRGQTLALVGESGCGKSTIAFALVDFLGPNGVVTSGRVLFQGREMTGRSAAEMRKLRGNRISMVFQDPMQALNPSLRLGRQMAEVLTTHQGLSDSQARKRSAAMLERVHMPDPEGIMKRYPHQISGGQQQRVVIAMAMLNNPALLIMDEPTTALDVTVEAAVLDLVADLKRDYNTGIVYITHDLGVVARVADRMAVMYAGEMVERGRVEEVFAQPAHPYTAGLLGCIPRLGTCKTDCELSPIRGRVPRPSERPEQACVFSPRCDFSQEGCAQRRPELVAVAGLDGPDQERRVRCIRQAELAGGLLAGPPRPVAPAPEAAGPEATAGEAPTLLELSGLKTYYGTEADSWRAKLGLAKPGRVKAVDDVSLAVPRGSIFGLVGESGCGKTTLIKTVLGLEEATGGRLCFEGLDITRPLDKRRLDQVKKLQIVFQNPDATLNPTYSIGRQVARPLKRFGLARGAGVRARVGQLLNAVRLPASYSERLPRQLSGGEKQRVGLARALASDPELILCDEPVSALDVSVQAAVLKLLLEIQAQFDTTMVFISHDLSVVRYICDFIAVMYLGRIVEMGPARAVCEPPFHPYTAALLSAVPVADPGFAGRPVRLSGNVPSALDPPPGCRFHTRCPWREQAPEGGRICATEEPPRLDLGRGHYINCHLGPEKTGLININQGPPDQPARRTD